MPVTGMTISQQAEWQKELNTPIIQTHFYSPQNSLHVNTTVAGTSETAPAQALVNTMEIAAMTTTVSKAQTRTSLQMVITVPAQQYSVWL